VTVLLIALGVAAGVEIVADRQVWIPMTVGAVVVAAAFAVGPGDGAFAGVLVGASTTAVSWWCSRDAARIGPAVAVAIAGGAGAAVGWLVSRGDHAGGAVVAGLGGLAGFAAVALLAARGRSRRREAIVSVWGAPVGAAVLGAGVLVVTRTSPAITPVVALVLSAVLLAWCGSPPWRSRVLSPRLGGLGGLGGFGGRGGSWRRSVLQGLGAVGVTAAVVAALARGEASAVAVVAAAGSAAGCVAMAAGTVRQWRFAPRARARDATALVVASVCVAVYPVAATEDAWWSVAPALVALVAALVVGRGPVARGDRDAAPIPSDGRRT
jgi:hypothetical protein